MYFMVWNGELDNFTGCLAGNGCAGSTLEMYVIVMMVGTATSLSTNGVVAFFIFLICFVNDALLA